LSCVSLGLGGSSSWGSGDVWDGSVSSIWVSVEAVTVAGVRIGDVLNNSGSSSGGVDGRWVTGEGVAGVGVAGVAGEGADSVEDIDAVLVPRWVDTMNAVVLLSSFLILGLHGESASSQSHQNQKGLME
jgi:hypothetical protein